MDPLPALHELLEGNGEPAYKVRSTLRRLLVAFKLVAKPSRHVSVFRIELQPGICLADLSDTAVIDSTAVQFEVTCQSSPYRPVGWRVNGRKV
jgi:hypothetical protein